MTGRDMGIRSQRYSMVVENGTVRQLNIDPLGQIELSTAETMLRQLMCRLFGGRARLTRHSFHALNSSEGKIRR
jgi:hypothetical protein